jgi:CheY-like chemotaxis protein
VRYLDAEASRSTVAVGGGGGGVFMAATVMVVEDDALIREIVIEILGSGGFIGVGARNGEEALLHLRQDHVQPALILLDLMMPVMNGWQFRAEQLRDPKLAGIPVVVMSASSCEDDVPAEAHVAKPFTIEVLLDTVSRFARSGSMLH